MNIVHMTTQLEGGAGIAVSRLVDSISRFDIETKVYSRYEENNDTRYARLPTNADDNTTRFTEWGLGGGENLYKDNTPFSFNVISLSIADLDKIVEENDIIHLHFIDRFLSVENIAYLSHQNKPIVWTIHDYHPFTGGCHYFSGCAEYQKSCANCPQLRNNFMDFPAKVLEAKKRHFNFENIHIVALSTHSRDIIQQSIFRDCDISIIPYGIDIKSFKPINKNEAKEKFRIPLDKKVLFYMPLYDKKVKGKKELMQALDMLKRREDYFLLVAGKDKNGDELYSDIERIFIERGDYKSLGYIKDQTILVDAYSAADIMMVPSLEESFSYTTAEALSCGTPVVGFKIGGLADMIRNGENGYTVSLGDCEALAKAIELVSEKSVEMGYNARVYAEEYLPLDLQGILHKKLYQTLYQKYLSAKKIETVDTQSSHSVIGTAPFDELQASSCEISTYALLRTLQYHEQALENAKKYIYYRFYNASFIRRMTLIFMFVGKKINPNNNSNNNSSQAIETISIHTQQDTEEKNDNTKISLEDKKNDIIEMSHAIAIVEKNISDIRENFGYKFGLSSRREKILLLLRYIFRIPPKTLSQIPPYI